MRIIALLLTLCLLSNVAGMEAPSKDRATVLVQQLGSSRYQQREQAQEQLRSIGKAALPALEAGLKSRNPEIRIRCQRLVPLIRQSDTEKQLREFITHGLRKGEKPLEGWDQYQKLVGSDYKARALFVEIYRIDAELLKLAQRSPKDAAKQFTSRCQKLQRQNYNGFRPNLKVKPVPLGELGAFLYVVRCGSKKLDNNQFNQFYSALTRPSVREAGLGDAQIKQMIEEVIEARGLNQTSFYQWAYLISQYQLTRLANEVLKPDIEKRIKTILKNPSQISQLRSIVSQVQMLGLTDVVENQIKPGIEQMGSQFASKPPDLNQLYTLASMAQQLRLQKTMNDVLKPAFLAMLEKQVKSNGRLSYQVSYLTRILNAQKEASHLIWPKLMDRMLKAVSNPSESELNRLINEAQYVGKIQEAQAILRPAAITLLQKQLEKANDLNALQRAYYLSNRFGGSGMDEVIKAKVEDQIQKIARGKLDVNRAQQIYYLANNLGMQQTIEKTIKPMFVKAIQEELARKSPSSNAGRLLSLAEMMGMKEITPLALLVAGQRQGRNYERARALYLVGRFGKKEHVEKLSELVNDSTVVSNINFNGTKITTQVGDIALATMIHLSGGNILKYDFDYAKQFGRGYLNTPYSYLGFSSDKLRKKALQKWKAKQATGS